MCVRTSLDNNYKVRTDRMLKQIEDDSFIAYCNGKIDCLRGLEIFIIETVGDSNVNSN
jgi:hypothetical protein